MGKSTISMAIVTIVTIVILNYQRVSQWILTGHRSHSDYSDLAWESFFLMLQQNNEKKKGDSMDAGTSTAINQIPDSRVQNSNNFQFCAARK